MSHFRFAVKKNRKKYFDSIMGINDLEEIIESDQRIRVPFSTVYNSS
jgi:hypothetical protein